MMVKIMVVDDDPDALHTVRRMLEKEGYTVVEAGSGKECIKKVKTENPDLIILDAIMPDMDGWETAKILKDDEETKHIPISMLTVRTEEVDKIKSFEFSGVNAHITKPINKEKMMKTIEWLLKNLPDR